MRGTYRESNKTENNNCVEATLRGVGSLTILRREQEQTLLTLKTCLELFAFIRHIFVIFISRADAPFPSSVSHNQLFGYRSLKGGEES